LYHWLFHATPTPIEEGEINAPVFIALLEFEAICLVEEMAREEHNTVLSIWNCHVGVVCALQKCVYWAVGLL
jgi:hypothetical protein